MLVYTGGSFDLFHSGHATFLKELWRLSGAENFNGQSAVIVGLNTDSFIEEYKGKPPVNSYFERKTVLEACRYVSRVVENVGGADSKPTIESVGPDAIGIGSDWHYPKDYLSQMDLTWEWLRERGCGILYISRTPDISTTQLKEKIYGTGGDLDP